MSEICEDRLDLSIVIKDGVISDFHEIIDAPSALSKGLLPPGRRSLLRSDDSACRSDLCIVLSPR
jgi:hypothetical protein